MAVYLLYDLILVLSALVLVPFYLLRGLAGGKVRQGVRERFGMYPPGGFAVLKGREVIWIHAVSVGETRAAIPLIKALKKVYPESALVLSNVTETGRAIANGIGEVDLRLFFPFDLSWVVRRVIGRVRPSLIAVVETEIWPNFVRVARQADIPVLLVNGRISDRSFPRYLRMRSLIEPILKKFSALCMQTELDAERIRAMGAPAGLVQVTRNLKFDMKPPGLDEKDVEELKKGFRLPRDLSIWVAGSTHAGEEAAVSNAYRQLLAAGQELVLVLVPRHPERCPAVAEELARQGLACRLRSRLTAQESFLGPGDVLLIDSVGEMLKLYAVADLVFVGGSLVNVGGHNVLEASLLKKPVIFGSFMHNFKEISRLLIEEGGGRQIAREEELGPAVKELLGNEALRSAMGTAGFRLLAKNMGATDQTMAVIRGILGR